MKTEQKLEVYRELFGSLPEAPAGKELIGVKCKPPKVGDYYYFCTKWLENVAGDYASHEERMVAIFRDTHRADGTPLSIDKLPDVEGYRAEYLGNNVKSLGDFDFFICAEKECGGWMDNRFKTGFSNNGDYYATYCKIAQPTTLADLVGKHGQNNVWLHTEDGCLTQAIIASTPCQPLALRGADEKWHEVADLLDSRWSNDPFTSWADAKEFIPETK